MEPKRVVLCLALLAAVLAAGCNLGGGEEPTGAYVAEFTAADEDFVDFGTMASFMNGGSWTILEKAKVRAGATVGWHMFRGKGWEDKDGDVAIQMQCNSAGGQVYSWVRYGGAWHILYMNEGDAGLEILDDTWYTICLRYDHTTEELQLYVNGTFIAQQPSFPAIDDSANDNKLFWGGQDVDPGKGEGDLTSEADAVIAHQAWIQRALTPAEIAAYDGSFDLSDPDLFFTTEITKTGVLKAGGSGGADGTNGNSPQFYLEVM